jgi:hypothetical protein
MRTPFHRLPTTGDADRAERTDVNNVDSGEQTLSWPHPDGVHPADPASGSNRAPYKFICASHRDQQGARYRRVQRAYEARRAVGPARRG